MSAYLSGRSATLDTGAAIRDTRRVSYDRSVDIGRSSATAELTTATEGVGSLHCPDRARKDSLPLGVDDLVIRRSTKKQGTSATHPLFTNQPLPVQ